MMTCAAILFPVSHRQLCIDEVLWDLNLVQTTVTMSGRCLPQVFFVLIGVGIEVHSRTRILLYLGGSRWTFKDRE